MLAVGGSEGGSVKVFKISCKAKSRNTSSDDTKEPDEKMIGNEPGANVGIAFEMLRGVSPSSIRDIEWTESGLWSGFVSGNGTLRKSDIISFVWVLCHGLMLIVSLLDMFAVSPEGGVVDELSHLTGKTRNTAPRRSVSSDYTIILLGY
jgi:hypothetical protein